MDFLYGLNSLKTSNCISVREGVRKKLLVAVRSVLNGPPPPFGKNQFFADFEDFLKHFSICISKDPEWYNTYVFDKRNKI